MCTAGRTSRAGTINAALPIRAGLATPMFLSHFFFFFFGFFVLLHFSLGGGERPRPFSALRLAVELESSRRVDDLAARSGKKRGTLGVNAMGETEARLRADLQ